MESSPFAFLIRSMHIAPRQGLEDDSKEVFYDCEVETCVFDPECELGSPKFCAACGEVEHVVHGCALLDLGRMRMDGREAQTCDTQVEQVGKSKQTHEPCVALDLALPIGSECVRDESPELERCVEGSFAAFEPSSPTDRHRRAGCGLFELANSCDVVNRNPTESCCDWIDISCTCCGKLQLCLDWKAWKMPDERRFEL